MIAYRPDIDGLRAIAVLLVIAFHAFPGVVKSGFIGVDIFFVISGYLITAIIIKDLGQHRFSFLGFYVRRARRIFPALILVMAGCYSAGWLLLDSREFEQLSKHVAGGAVFASNFVLWGEASYFDVSAHYKPLLHLWSLGIEEQFYLLWPWLLIALWAKKGLLRSIIALSLASFALNVLLSNQEDSARFSFYWPITRMWEFGAGGFVACISRGARAQTNRFHVISRHFSMAGAILLLVGALLIRDTRVYPGWWALLPVMGATFLILGGPAAWFNRTVLSNRVLVWVGLISYPLYLWHWPLLSMARIVHGKPVPLIWIVLLLLATLILSWLTYIYVEKPVRSGVQARRIAGGLTLTLGLIGLAGMQGYLQEGYPARDANKKIVINQGETGDDPYREFVRSRFIPCEHEQIRQGSPLWNGVRQCFQSRPGKVDVVIVGDSHADHLFGGLAASLPHLNVAEYWRGAGGGLGFPGIHRKDFTEIYRYILQNPNIKVVIISAYWLEWVSPAHVKENMEELGGTVKALAEAGKAVYISDDVPVFDFNPALCKFQKNSFISSECTMPLGRFLTQRTGYRGHLEQLQAGGHAKILNTAERFCDAENCFMAQNALLLYRDEHHMNSNGSLYLASRLLRDELRFLIDLR